jgi:SOS response regulatory protein OraA/RecX
MNYYQKLIDYSLNLISKKRYTVSELSKKLITASSRIKKKSDIEVEDEFDSGEGENDDYVLSVKSVIARLIELNYLDDKKYAIDYIQDRIKFRPRGKYMITGELKRKGVSKSDIEFAFKNVEFCESDVAMSLIKKRISRWSKFDKYVQKQKACLYLSSNGFDRETIYKTIESCYNH